MAQVRPLSTTSNTLRPHASSERSRPLNAPRISPSHMPDPLITSSTNRSGHFHLDTFSPVNQNGSFEFDRVIKSGKVLRRTKKKGAWKPSWKSAFLVLRPNLLSVYKNENETELKASITLSEVTAVATVKKTKTDNVFGIFTSAKNFHFSGFSERDASDWVTLIRLEARTDQEEELDLPAPGFHGGNAENVESETTDFSAEDEGDRPGSPEAPHWVVRGNKSRSSTQTGQRKISNLREYPVNEQNETSQSDFSDAAAAGLSNPTPRKASSVTSALPNQTGKLTTIPSEEPSSEPLNLRSTSQNSLQDILPPAPIQTQQADPNRVIRQGYLTLLKTVSGVRQWKSTWAVLRPSGLSLYKSTSEYEPLKILDISSLIDAAEIDPLAKSKRYCFQVIGEEKTWKFSVDSEAELEGWLGALKSVLVKKGRGISSSHGLPLATPTAPVMIPGSSTGGSVVGHERGKENAGGAHSPPVLTRGSTRTEPVGLDNIVEGTDEMKVS